MFPIKYIDNNLVWNKDNEVFAYYELIPYNYSFLSAEQKFIVHDSFRQLIAQSREGKIHALQIATESSIRSMQEQSKKLVTGKLKEVACQKIDEQTEALVSMIGDNQVDYRFFLGFKLMVTEEQLNLKNIKKSAWLTFTEFLHEVNHTLMNDFVSMPNDEINRYMKMEKLLENKISRRFKVRRLEINDFGYLMEHLYGRDGIAYEDYEYQLPKKKLNKETLIKYYDLIRPTRCVIEESQRYLRLEHEDKESYVSYFTVNAIVGELDFPSSEIFYFQQQQFTFPVDTSMNVEIVENRKALTTVRNKKKELKDLDNHAYQAGSETSSNVVDALDSVDELETDLDQTKESMYKLSYVIRVSASDLDELKRRCDEVKDFYDDLNVKLVRPAGDMLGLHSEFLPASKRYINDYVQYVKSDFLAGLGFGATQQLGETTGIYMGYSVDTGRNVYLQPSLASQGVKGTVTNALASAFVGSLGGGKSFCNNLLVYYAVLFGGQRKVIINIHDIENVVYTDEKWLTFILSQIVQNAIKYFDKQENKLTIYSQDNGTNILLVIEDNGCGIKTSDLSRVFEKGFTGSNRNKANATGMGLYLSKKLCDRLGLKLDIASTEKEYTRLTIIFPKGTVHNFSE